MELTKEKAIELSIELWEWLAETGSEYKRDWPEWEKYGKVDVNCFLCAYVRLTGCGACPYDEIFGWCDTNDAPYHRWYNVKTIEDRKKYAKKFLAQLKEL